MEDLARTRKLFMIGGVLAVIAGIVAIAVPAVASVGTAVFIGWLLLFSSAALVVHAFSGGHAGRVLLRLLLAVLTFAAGLYLLVAPLEGTYTLTVMLVIWFIAIGFGRIAAGLVTLGTPGAGVTALSGLVSVVLGVLIARELPSSADWAIGLLVGIDFLFFGMSAIWAASQLKTDPDAPPPVV